MSFIRYKKRGNKWYVYEVTSFWDKKTKAPKQKSSYLGVSDSDGGLYSKPGKIVAAKTEKEILDFGDSFAIQQIANNSGFLKVLDNSFAESDSIMTLICYQMLEALLCIYVKIGLTEMLQNIYFQKPKQTHRQLVC